MKTPVLTIHFNRPYASKILIEKLKIVRPSRLYIGIDGPRASRLDEGRLVNSVKTLFDQIDWPCEVFKNYYVENQGCKRAVQGHLKWFFENESEGIILEDDCFPDPSFFAYASELLCRFRDDSRIASINGHSLGYKGNRSKSSFRFTPFMNMWGWATWRRTYELVDTEMSLLRSCSQPEDLIREILTPYTLAADHRWIKYWALQFQETATGQIDTWDYQWIFSILANKMWSISPKVNMIENVGWGSDATHTRDLNPFVAGLKSSSCMLPLNVPQAFDLDFGYEEHIKEAWCDLDRFYESFIAEKSCKINQNPFQEAISRIRRRLIKRAIKKRYGF